MISEKICYATLFVAEALTTWQYVEYLFSKKKPLGFLACSFICGYAILFAVSLLDNTTGNAIVFFIVNYFLIELNYQVSRKTALLHTALLCFVMVVSESLIALVISLFGYEFDAYTYNFSVMIVLIILSKLLYLMFSAIGSRIFSPNKDIKEEPHLMVLFCSLPILSASIAIVIVYFGMNAGINGTIGIMTIMIIVTLLIANLIFLVLYNYLQKTNAEHLAFQLSVQKDQADTSYYKALQEQYDNQRILIHDIKKHLGTIDALAKQTRDTEIEEYVSSLNATLTPSSQAKYCTEPILNLILSRFYDECKNQCVEFHCDVRENISAFMDASSITALYGNLLSNSLEAATNSVEKQIELSVTKNVLQSIIVISAINSCGVAPTPDGHGGFLTKKPDRILHGVGLRSINRVVKRYNGIATMYYDQDKKQFHHIIQFPIPL